MTRFAWAHHAVQALKSDSKGNLGSQDSHRADELRLSHGDGKFSKEPKLDSRVKDGQGLGIHGTGAYGRSADFKQHSHFDSAIDVWSSSTVSPVPPRIPTPDSFDEGCFSWDGTTRSPDLETEASTDDGLQGSSTFFAKSPFAPVTIIITAPEPNKEPIAEKTISDETTTERAIRTEGDGRKLKNANGFFIPSLPKAILQPGVSTESELDRTRLMPPIDHQIDQHKLHQSHEFQNVRKWLIGFINAKGDQFQQGLRSRMMEIYGINELDLDAEVVAKFSGSPIQDDGVDRGDIDRKQRNAESLRVLGAAFQSQIKALPAKMHQQTIPFVPVSSTRKESSRRSISENHQRPSASVTSFKFPSDPQSPSKRPYYLQKSASAPLLCGPSLSTSLCPPPRYPPPPPHPNLRHSRSMFLPPCSSSSPRPSLQDATTKTNEADQKSKQIRTSSEKHTRIKRSNFVTMSFEFVRDVVVGGGGGSRIRRRVDAKG